MPWRHGVCHEAGGNPTYQKVLDRVIERQVEMIAQMARDLADVPEGDGTMLDSTLFLYGTGISDSNTHFHDDLPIALVAGKSTGITGGRYVRYSEGTPLANLHVSILEKLGTPVETFGDSTGVLKHLST